MEFTFEPGKKYSKDDWERVRANMFNTSVGEKNRVDGYDCPKCLNRGSFASAEPDPCGGLHLVFRDCKCMKIRRSINSLNRSGLKNTISKCRFENYETTEEWQNVLKSKATDFLTSEERLFFIGGQSGIGKTHLCTAMCREYILGGKEVKYLLWRDYAAQMKSYRDEEENDNLKTLCKTVEVLYIDDMFKTGTSGDSQKPTITDINVAFELINARYLNPNLITLISSENTLNNIIDIDEAVAGRIKEMSGKYCVNVGKDRSKNYRLKDIVEL